MRAYKYLHRAPVRVIRINRQAQRLKLRRLMLSLKLALHQEKVETQEMLTIYKRHTRGQASKEELAVAHAQFFDVLRGIGLGIFAILPFAPITIPIIVKLGRLVGVEVIPSAFLAKKPLKGDSTEL
ncbi:hypothetical protein OLW01_00560 [Catenovulum adriaticum]|uniref:LETM1-like protein n=2 Tax=Catenovulum adriaticum TaxID=2984846 RepID=A0ABY7ALB4_9ALTE|nr:hypothetical protein OLW01_00560 [Catenovulum sp. TS8]